ncbi:hypothetical protein AX16_009066 [Volvariella volvacea WC 439]|nr:hypothetical protein AX16_009066 [Volvariella volvacea WC 439]
MPFMVPPALLATFGLGFLTFNVGQANALTSYANDWVDPGYILAGGFGDNTRGARGTIVDWARELAAEGPWSVMNKTGTPPSGDKHDYMSWAPYWWPDCSNAGNTTELSQEEIWTTCEYVSRDGQFNPDVRLVNDIGAFQDLSDAVLYNTITWALQGDSSSEWSRNVVHWIRTWFLDEETRMNPHLDYAQIVRGPNSTLGSRTGVLDLKGMTKVVNAILILRDGQSSDWTSELDEQMNEWSRQYINWLETSSLALQEGTSNNNHGTFYYNQLAALKILIGDMAGATNVTDTYFNRQYMFQIEENGEQPLEAARTRPYHYRAYNLAAMITNARLAAYANPELAFNNSDGTPNPNSIWLKPTDGGSNIQTALDFAMQFSASDSGEDNYAAELYPNVGAVASIYGDPEGKYVAYLRSVEPGYGDEAWFLWNQPLEGRSLHGGGGSSVGGNVGGSGDGEDEDEDSGVGKMKMSYSAMFLSVVAGFAAGLF